MGYYTKITADSEGRGPGHIAVWTIAAKALLMLGIVLVLTRRGDEPSAGALAIAANESAVRRLEDGTIVSVDARTMLRVAFTDHRRDVHLLGGKALFDVAIDTNRPFIVNTFLVDVTAEVEAKFAVDIGSSVEVEVYKGAVDVSGRGTKTGSPVIRVKRGETFRIPVERLGSIFASRSAG